MDTITQYANKALDAVYQRTAGRMLAQIGALATSQNGRMQSALKKLDEEAQRLKKDDKRLTPDNPVLKNALGEYENTMETAARLIQANDNQIQDAGIAIASAAVTAKVFLGLSGQVMQDGGNPVSPQAVKFYGEQIEQQGLVWNAISTLDTVTSYVDSPAWIARMEGWGKGYADLTRDIILKDIQNGAGPIATARHLRQVAEGLPVSASESLTRTLQLTSYREASLAMETANDGYILGKIRIAELDDRTCISCIALHGTPLEVGQRVDDHYNGRCTEFYQVPGGDKYPKYMQADSQAGARQFVPFQSGVDWFASLSPDRQAEQASFLNSPAKLRAYRDGTPLTEFIGDHEDSVFGHQFVERSLIDILGEDAEKYYTVNQ